jgi:zinc D-Ala-D-Ala carboxypeptidase
MKTLSKHVTMEEFCYSPTAIKKGINNSMGLIAIDKAIQLCENVFEPLRKHLNAPIKISSGFRCEQLNKLIGGASGSQHTKGEAFDLELTDRKLFDWILKNLEFDQAIYEFGNDAHANWFHISYRKGNNRKQALRAIKIGGKTQYIPYKPL